MGGSQTNLAWGALLDLSGTGAKRERLVEEVDDLRDAHRLV
jgi:hypothetical protein